MKKLYFISAVTLIILLGTALTLFAQAPEAFTYQAEARDSRGRILANAIIDIKATILNQTGTVTPAETNKWQGEYNLKTDKFGLFTIVIGREGDATNVVGDFPGINWGDGKFFLKIEIKIGGIWTPVSTAQLLSVPYALYAKSAGGTAGSIEWSRITNKPSFSTVATSGSYNDLLNQPSLFDGNYNSLTNKPILFSGNYNDLTNKPALFDGSWTSLTLKPSTLAGYGITDAMNISHAANGITTNNISNWNTAYNWGSHAGLYKLVSYVPAWSEITGNPFSISSPVSNQLLKYNSVSLKWENWTPDYITNYTETDPIFSDWNKSTGISINASQVSDFQTSVTNNTAVVANTAKITNATHTGDVTGSEGLIIANKVTMTAALPVSVTGSPTVIATSPVSISISAATTSSAGSLSASDKTKLDAISGTNTGDQNLASVLTMNNSANSQTITDLANPVNAQDAATKLYVDAIKETIYNELLDAGLNGIVKDVDNNTYKTIKIGTQVWMAENLKTTKYNDGYAIPLVTGNTAWGNLTTSGYCWYNNNQSTYGNTYGALYNWHAVNTGKLCPSGWHVPSDAEWTTLTTFLGGESVAGGKMKETGTTHWQSPNTGATNESGFSGLPGGIRSYDGTSFYYIGVSSYWCSSTEYAATYAWFQNLEYNHTDVYRSYSGKTVGFSIRCVRDN